MTSTTPWKVTPVTPFGATIQSQTPGESLIDIPVDVIKAWVDEHRMLILRGFAALEGDAFPAYGATLGKVQEWSFGAVNELKVNPDSKNYLYTTSEVPFHWDGAFVGIIPHYIVFHCEAAPPPDSGGETLFTDAVALLEKAPAECKALWERTEITYSTEKLAHYGGSFTSPMIGKHQETGEEVLRYAEPVEDLNPVSLEIPNLTAEERAEFLTDLRTRLRDANLCYAHVWQDGDYLIADNHALLHGRNAFKHPETRHIRRVNVL